MSKKERQQERKKESLYRYWRFWNNNEAKKFVSHKRRNKKIYIIYNET